MANVQITKQDVYDISKRIIETWPYSDCKQINTFATLDTADELELENLGKTYQDYLEGLFYSRKWVLSGADPDKLKKQYPIHAIEQKTLNLPNLFKKNGCYTFWMIFLDVLDCPTCKDQCKRTKEQVDCDLQEMAVLYLQEFKTYGIYRIRFTGETETVNVWISSGQAEYWKATSQVEVCTLLMDIEAFVDTDSIEIFPTEAGSTDDARAVVFSIKICTCFDMLQSFDYRALDKDVKKIAEAKCNTC